VNGQGLGPAWLPTVLSLLAWLALLIPIVIGLTWGTP
jgi:hypothetical protein